MFVFIILVGLGIYTYYKFEKPAQNDVVEYADLNIYAVEQNESLQQKASVLTNFDIYVDNVFYKNGSTVLGGATLIRVPINKSITLINKNTVTQTYYVNLIEFYTDKTKSPFRLTFNLVSPSDIKFTQDGILNSDGGIINLTLSSLGYVNKIDFCIDWGKHIIKVSPNDFQEISKPKRMEKLYRCYSTGKNLNNDNFTISLTYRIFGDVDKADYIKLIFIDEDYVKEKGGFSPEGINGEDIAKKGEYSS